MLSHVTDCVVAFAALLAIFEYFGIKKDHPMWGFRMPLNRRWKLIVMVCLVAASFGMSGYRLYRELRSPSPSADHVVHFDHGDEVIEVAHRTFVNEVVELDNHRYSDCVFENVTFKYDGTGLVQFDHNLIRGSVQVKTDSDSVTATVALLGGLGLLKSDMALFEGANRVPMMVQPPMPRQ